MDGQQFLVENARRKARVDALVVEQLKEIFLFARAAAGDDGHIHPGSDRVQHLKIEAGADTIGVNAVQTDLPRAMRHAPADPVQRVPTGILAPTLGEHPELAVHPLHVRREHHALVAVFPGRRRDEAGVPQSARVDADLIGTAFQHPVKILQRVDAAAYGQRDEDLTGHPGQDIGEQSTALKAGGDIVEHQLVGTGSVVHPGHLHRVGHVPDALKVCALVIEIKPYRERQKRTLYPPKESNRDKLCAVIDNILLNEKSVDFESFLQKLEQQGYEIKRGKHTSVKGARQKRFIRFRTLGAGYSEDEIKAVIAGEAEHRPHQKQPPKEQPFHLLVDIQSKLSEGKSEGYAQWAKRYNLKEMSKTLIFLQENKIGSIEEMQERVDAATARYHELGDSIKASENRLAEIAVLKAHITNYAKTRPVYDAYRKTGYSKRFLETHRTEITLHKAAKAAFDKANLKKLPKVKELDAEYSKLLTEKKVRYPDYRKAKEEMQELLRAKRNVEMFFAEEKSIAEKMKSR